MWILIWKAEKEGNFLKTLNRIILSGTRKEIINTINENRNSKVFYIKKKPSVSIFLYLLNNTKVEKIIFLPSIKKTVSKKVLNALKKSKIKIIVKKEKIGRPSKLKVKKFKKIIGKKITDKKKIKKLKISRRTFYYWKKEKIKIN